MAPLMSGLFGAQFWVGGLLGPAQIQTFLVISYRNTEVFIRYTQPIAAHIGIGGQHAVADLCMQEEWVWDRAVGYDHTGFIPLP